MPRKKDIRKTCQRCGQDFLTRDPSARYCSRKCGQPNQSKRVELTCRQCGATFERKAYMASWSQERGPFCGFACYGAWQSEHAQGDQNPNFRAESSARGAGQWERNRLIVLDRDNHQCQDCGRTDRLHVHHRADWNPDDPATHVPDNLVTLCATCHRRRHPLQHGSDGRFLSTQ